MKQFKPFSFFLFNFFGEGGLFVFIVRNVFPSCSQKISQVPYVFLKTFPIISFLIPYCLAIVQLPCMKGGEIMEAYLYSYVGEWPKVPKTLVIIKWLLLKKYNCGCTIH
jgi:hypothetical protein